jgi:hypothetical protein
MNTVHNSIYSCHAIQSLIGKGYERRVVIDIVATAAAACSYSIEAGSDAGPALIANSRLFAVGRANL